MNTKTPHSIAQTARTPTGFNPSAQGCEARATLGRVIKRRHNPERVESIHRSAIQRFNPFRVEQIVPPKPKVARASQPWAEFWNPFRIQTRAGRNFNYPSV